MSEVISAINAKPESVRTFLGSNEYVIPDYQRPYSWGKDESVQLWEDILNFYKENKEAKINSPYFLGNIVIYNKDSSRYVIDGQQRLITLNLLISALLKSCNTFKALEAVLYKKDKITDKLLNPKQIKIDHRVLGGNENDHLKAILLNESKVEDERDKSIFQKNYEVFRGRIEEFFKQENSPEIKDFISTILDKIVVLPIECTDFESALTIFETINNRGMDLSDTDIFKSKLLHYI
jgi:uncharacterized protein with ParB-like and HNH nuclease domain